MPETDLITQIGQAVWAKLFPDGDEPTALESAISADDRYNWFDKDVKPPVDGLPSRFPRITLDQGTEFEIDPNAGNYSFRNKQGFIIHVETDYLLLSDLNRLRKLITDALKGTEPHNFGLDFIYRWAAKGRDGWSETTGRRELFFELTIVYVDFYVQPTL